MRTQEYESIYKAGIEVASNPTRHVSSSRRKRNDEDDDEPEDGRCVLTFACVMGTEFACDGCREEDRKRTAPLNGSHQFLNSNIPSHVESDPDAMEL